MRALSTRVWLTGGTLAALLIAANVPEPSPAQAVTADDTLAVADGVVVRDWADGAGPSHLIPVGEWLLVVDPWAAEIKRYRRDDLHAAPRSCSIPRSFAPWRTIASGNSIRLVTEPYGPTSKGDYAYAARSTMVLDAAQVAAMPSGVPCNFAIQAYDAARDTPPAIGRDKGELPGAVASFPLPNGKRARIAPRGGPRADIYAVRPAGMLSGGRSLLWWSEIDAYPIEKPTAKRRPDPPGYGGRVTASQYVGVFEAAGGNPTKVVRIQTAAYGKLVPRTQIPAYESVGKLGFEYVAGGTQNGADMLWVLALDLTKKAKPFALRRYALGQITGETGELVLTVAGADGAGRNDAEHDELAEPTKPDPQALASRSAWFENLRPVFWRQIGFAWEYPQAALQRPCGDSRDKCAVGANPAGQLGTGALFAKPVADAEAGASGAEWMRPRQLVGVTPGSTRLGVPYSIGGVTWVGANAEAEDFRIQRDADYKAPKVNPRPIGHIREGMEWTNAGGNYPLGIDCSALVAQVFGTSVRGTGKMREPALWPTASGTYALPLGAVRACPQPVRHLSQIMPGDLLLTKGHIVIYAGTARLGGEAGRSRGLRVFESSSRCGGVCESVYDPSSLDGWWILRMRLAPGDDRDCPAWLNTAAAILAEFGQN